MRKLSRKQLRKVLKQANENEVSLSKNKKKNSITYDKSFEKQKVITTWNHEKGSLVKFHKSFYYDRTGAVIDKGEIGLVIGDSYMHNRAKENCFYILINSFVIQISGGFYRTI